jgi:hypothetical protein
VFGIDITPIEFFEKKYHPETVTCLMLQALSKAMSNYPLLKNYMCHHKIYNPKDSLVGLAVLIPGSQDHLSMIEFKNCHEMSIASLSHHIKFDIGIISYCYKRTEELKKEHHWLQDIFNKTFVPRAESFSRHFHAPQMAKPAISLSNIGHWGYDTPISPLFPDEAVKLTLGKIERKQVWNNTIREFETRDILPVGISVDHRVFDANIPVPGLMQTGFDQMFQMMHQNTASAESARGASELNRFIEATEKSLKTNLEMTFKGLMFSSHIWRNHRAQLTPQSVFGVEKDYPVTT